MNVQGKIIKWSIEEVAAFAVTVASITTAVILWSISNFQSKEEASELKQNINERLSKVELEVQILRSSVGQISVDVSYIRGRLEPKGK
jgi:hypothetical protein